MESKIKINYFRRIMMKYGINSTYHVLNLLRNMGTTIKGSERIRYILRLLSLIISGNSVKWDQCQLFSFKIMKKITENLPGGAEGPCIAQLLALDSLGKPYIIRKGPNSRKNLCCRPRKIFLSILENLAKQAIFLQKYLKKSKGIITGGPERKPLSSQ